MIKKKAQKTLFQLFRFLARTFILNSPTILALFILLFLHKINWITALSVFIIVFTITATITAWVFRELEKFIAYLRRLAQGIEADPPRFHRGIFGSFRLANAFLSVKNMWSRQTLSDTHILENLPDPLLMINQTANIVFANERARDLFGDEIMHQPLHTLLSDETFTTALNQIIADKTKKEWFEWDYQDIVPYSFQVHFERLPSFAKNGAIAVIVMHDITQMKLFKQQQADFFANASHELKTPLSIVSGFIETLQGPAKEDIAVQDKFLKLMAEQTSRMTHLVQDLLALSKLQMNTKNTFNDVVLIPEVLKSVLEALTVKAATENKTLSLDLVHDLPRLMGNKAELIQVFQNLVDNAIKYGAPKSTITVQAKLRNGFPKKSDRYFSDMRQVIQITVHNMGHPISPQNINRLFERFYRTNTPKTRSVEGTGLGLGIVQQIVVKHDGVIDVRSTEKEGTFFNVYLPVDF